MVLGYPDQHPDHRSFLLLKYSIASLKQFFNILYTVFNCQSLMIKCIYLNYKPDQVLLQGHILIREVQIFKDTLQINPFFII